MKPMVSAAMLFLTCSVMAQPRAAKQDQLRAGDRHAEVNGVSFSYSVIGTGPLLVIQAPGWGIGSSYLRGGLSPLAEHFTLLFYDTRGSGQSGRPADAKQMSTSDMVDDLEQLRHYWGLDSMALMGHSHGGAIALS